MPTCARSLMGTSSGSEGSLCGELGDSVFPVQFEAPSSSRVPLVSSQPLDQLSLLLEWRLMPLHSQVLLVPTRCRGKELHGHGPDWEGLPPPADPAPAACLTLLSWLPENPGGLPRPLTSSGGHICCSTTELGTQPGKRMGHRQCCGEGTAGRVEGLNSAYPRDQPLAGTGPTSGRAKPGSQPCSRPQSEERTPQSQAGQAECVHCGGLRREVQVRLAFGSPNTHTLCTSSASGHRRDFLHCPGPGFNLWSGN